MTRVFRPALSCLCLVAGLAACVPAPAPEPAPFEPVMTGSADMNRATVTDLAAFEAFIATRPSAEAFAERYPGVTLILPGMVSTRELRMDRSRYFAEVDAEGRIIGGQFQ